MYMDGTSMSPVTEGQDKHTTLQHGINIAILLGEHESGSHQCIEMSSFVFIFSLSHISGMI